MLLEVEGVYPWKEGDGALRTLAPIGIALAASPLIGPDRGCCDGRRQLSEIRLSISKSSAMNCSATGEDGVLWSVDLSWRVVGAVAGGI